MSTTDDTDPADELLAAADEDLLRYLRAGGIASRADVRDLLRMHNRLAEELAAERAQGNRTAAGAWGHGYQAHQDGVQRYHNPHVPHENHGACRDWCTALSTDPA